MGKKRKLEPRYAAPKPTLDDFLANRQAFNRVSTDFLKIDVATAFIFAKRAAQADDAAKRRRSQRAARIAYDTVHRFADKMDLTREDAEVLSSNLERLKSELQALGETF